MVEIETTILKHFEESLHLLKYRYEQSVKKNRELYNALQEKEELLKDLLQRYSTLEQKYNNLKQAKVISLSDAEVDTTRKRLTKLVREIDRCIESLKK